MAATATLARPKKLRQYGSVKEVIHRTFAQIGFKRAFNLLKVEKTRGYLFTDPDHPADLSFSAIAELTKAGSTAPVEYLAALAGGHFVPGTPCAEPLEELAAKAAVEVAQFTASVLVPAKPRIKLKLIDAGLNALARARARIAAQLND